MEFSLNDIARAIGVPLSTASRLRNGKQDWSRFGLYGRKRQVSSADVKYTMDVQSHFNHSGGKAETLKDTMHLITSASELNGYSNISPRTLRRYVKKAKRQGKFRFTKGGAMTVAKQKASTPSNLASLIHTCTHMSIFNYFSFLFIFLPYILLFPASHRPLLVPSPVALLLSLLMHYCAGMSVCARIHNALGWAVGCYFGRPDLSKLEAITRITSRSEEIFSRESICSWPRFGILGWRYVSSHDFHFTVSSRQRSYHVIMMMVVVVVVISIVSYRVDDDVLSYQRTQSLPCLCCFQFFLQSLL